jgi:hypothetical protein
LEVLIHPRALPLTDFPSASGNSSEGVDHKFSENVYSGSLKLDGRFTSDIHGIRNNIHDSDDDDLYDSWLENGKETEAPDSVPRNNTTYNEEPPETLGVSSGENLYVDGSSSARIPENMGQEAAASVDARMGGNDDEIMVEADQFQKNIAQGKEPVPSKGASVRGDEVVSERFVSSIDASDHADNVFAPGQDVLVAKSNENASATTSISAKITGDALDLDGEDPFPEIFDDEPDSDDEQA